MVFANLSELFCCETTNRGNNHFINIGIGFQDLRMLLQKGFPIAHPTFFQFVFLKDGKFNIGIPNIYD